MNFINLYYAKEFFISIFKLILFVVKFSTDIYPKFYYIFMTISNDSISYVFFKIIEL